MNDKTDEYRVTCTGNERAREQFLAALKDLQGEGSRGGVEISIEKIESTEMDTEFTSGSDHG